MKLLCVGDSRALELSCTCGESVEDGLLSVLGGRI